MEARRVGLKQCTKLVRERGREWEREDRHKSTISSSQQLVVYNSSHTRISPSMHSENQNEIEYIFNFNFN